MDPSLQPLLQCFGQTLSPDQSIRKRAEQELRAVENNAGFLRAILSIICQSPDPSITQAGAIYFKNSMVRRWHAEEDDKGYIQHDEKHLLRQDLVPAIVNASVTIRSQLSNVLNTVLGYDFPKAWPNFLDDTAALLQSSDIKSIYAGLLCLLELAKVYRWRSKDRRKGLDAIIQSTFPPLLNIANGLLLEDSELAGDMMRLILKIYKSVIWLELSKELQAMSSLVPWGQLLLKVITKTIPDDRKISDTAERAGQSWWRAKKWAYFSLDRLFQRYGDPTQLSGETAQDYGEFAKVFSSQFAPEILKCYLQQVQLWAADRNTGWLSPRALYYIGSFFTSCVKPRITWLLIKDNFDSLAEFFVFPQICQTTDDLELWDSDPQEYISKRIDIYDDYSSPDVAAINFLVACCSRKKTTCFMRTLEFVNRELTQYLQAPADKKDPKRKEGALRMIGTVSHLILREKSAVKPMMEQFFADHVFPEFKSPHGYLRARACEMMNRFAEIEFTNTVNLGIAYEGVMQCLMEKELPVRVEAALALQPLISQEYIHNAMVQSIPKIMRVLLQLANEVDVDSLSNVMEEFVEVFANELTPYAVELAEQLRDTFMRIMQDTIETQDGGDENGFEWSAVDDKSLSALGLLNTLGTLILSLEHNHDAYFKLEQTVLPVLLFVLNNEIVDLYAETFEIIDSCTFSAKMISPTMWGVFETLHSTFKSSGMDYIDELLPAIDNYIAFGKEGLITNPQYRAAIFDIVESVFTNDRLGVQDRIAAAKISQMLLLHLKGHVDDYLKPIMSLTLSKLSNPNEPKIKSYRFLLLETIINSIYYNPLVALDFLEANNGTTQLFQLWLDSKDQFVRVHDKKLFILTILNLLSLPPSQIPSSVKPGWSQLSIALLDVFQTLPDAIKRRDDAQKKLVTADTDWAGKSSDPEDDEWDDDALYGEDGDQDEQDPAGQEYLEFLGKEAQRLAQTSGDDEDDEEDEEMSEDVLFNSPLDTLDPYILTKVFFQTLHESNTPLYQEYTSAWDSDRQNQFTQIMKIAQSNESLLTNSMA